MFKRAVTGLEVIVVVMLVTSVITFIDYYDITKNFSKAIMMEGEL